MTSATPKKDTQTTPKKVNKITRRRLSTKDLATAAAAKANQAKKAQETEDVNETSTTPINSESEQESIITEDEAPMSLGSPKTTKRTKPIDASSATVSVNGNYEWLSETRVPIKQKDEIVVNQVQYAPVNTSKAVKFILKPEKVEMLRKQSNYKQWKSAFISYANELTGDQQEQYGSVLAHSRCLKEQVFKTLEYQIGKGDIEKTEWSRLRKAIKNLYGDDVAQIDALAKAEGLKDLFMIIARNYGGSAKWIDDIQHKVVGVLCNFFAKGETPKDQVKNLESSFQELAKAIYYAVSPAEMQEEAKQILMQKDYNKVLAATYANTLREINNRQVNKKAKSTSGPVRTTSVVSTPAASSAPYAKRRNIQLRKVPTDIYDERRRHSKCLNCGSTAHKVDKCENEVVTKH